MDRILATTGYLFFLYGAYLITSNYPADPVTKGAILIGLGFLLIGVGYLIVRRKYGKKGIRAGWEFQ